MLLTGSNPWAAIDFAYDWMGRRISKVYQTSTSDPTTSGGKYGPPILWAISRDTRYVYDGWHLSMSYKTTGSSLEDQSFAWGSDLSSSYGGAGGIGGLVAYSDDEHDALNPAPSDPDFLGPMFPIYDGNGNVVTMIRFESLGGSPEVFEARESASYEYGPFGENRSTTGELGAPATGGTHQGQRNPFRFSTKYTDAETGLVYYGYRYYSANLGRWISRDPIQEKGGLNLLGMLGNDAVNRLDLLGLDDYKLGTDDPTVSRDAGAGVWDGTPTTLEGWAQWYTTWQAAQVFRFIYPDASAHLRHYLWNSGDDYTIRLDKMIDDVPSAKGVFDWELGQAKKFAETLPPGEHEITSGKATPGYNLESESMNWYLAVGGYGAWGKGTVKVPCGDTEYYEMEFRFKFSDRYNWDTGKKIEYQGITITDKFMGELHRQGLAKEFDMNGEVIKKYYWKKGQTPSTTPPPSLSPPGRR